MNKLKYPSLPNIHIESKIGNNISIYTTLDILIYIRKCNILDVHLLDIGLITYAINKHQCSALIKKYMKSKNVNKACIRFSYGHNSSFLVDLNDESSFDIDYKSYIGSRLSLSNIIIHPIKSDKTYLKGVISMIYIDNKYSYSTLKKPYNINTGIRKYITTRYSPSYILLKLSKNIIPYINSKKNLPIIQINFCFGNNHNQYLLTKINYIDPKLYLQIHRKQTKNITKVLIKQYHELNKK